MPRKSPDRSTPVSAPWPGRIRSCLGARRPGGSALVRTGQVDTILVARLAGSAIRGKLIVGAQIIPCALGRTGIVHRKREGDGGTPAGTWGVVAVRQRRDRGSRLRTIVPNSPLQRRDGWCDDPTSARYNRAVTHPFGAGHEVLWRSDHLYDVIVVLDYNLRRPLPWRGSAIFFHVAAPGGEPTAGCIAIDAHAMRRLVSRFGRASRFKVLG